MKGLGAMENILFGLVKDLLQCLNDVDLVIAT
jgi:hypothetical protein